MSDTHSPVTWNSLAEDLETVKYGEIHDICIRGDITECVSETSSQASTRSDTSQRHATAVERVVRTLDDQRCFVTNRSGHAEVAHLLDDSNAGNGRLLDALRGLGIVHPNFNLDDVSNVFLMSRNLHFLWNKYAAFIIVPSTDTRKRMIEILNDDRKRIMLALQNKEVVKPCPLAYPGSVTFDIILVRPSLFGSGRRYFQRAENHDDIPTCYRIPKPSNSLHRRLEYLTKQDDEAHVFEFTNILHVTGRSSQQAINPYLMVINALPKLERWDGWSIGWSRLSVPDSVFTTAFEDCRNIAVLISLRMHGAIHMVLHDGQARRRERDDEETIPSTSSRDLAEEPESPVGSGHPHHEPATQPEPQSWISRGKFDKTNSLENWRQEVGEFSASFRTHP